MTTRNQNRDGPDPRGWNSTSRLPPPDPDPDPEPDPTPESPQTTPDPTPEPPTGEGPDKKLPVPLLPSQQPDSQDAGDPVTMQDYPPDPDPDPTPESPQTTPATSTSTSTGEGPDKKLPVPLLPSQQPDSQDAGDPVTMLDHPGARISLYYGGDALKLALLHQAGVGRRKGAGTGRSYVTARGAWTGQNNTWTAQDVLINELSALDPRMAYEFKYQLATGNVDKAYQIVNLVRLRSQLDKVDPETRENLRLAIEAGHIEDGFKVLADDEARDFKEYTGKDLPQDPAERDRIWAAETQRREAANAAAQADWDEHQVQVQAGLDAYAQSADPETRAAMQKAIAEGDLARASTIAQADWDEHQVQVRAGLDTYAQSADPETRAAMQKAIAEGDLARASTIAQAHYADKFRAVVGQEPTGDREADLLLWKEKTAQRGQVGQVLPQSSVMPDMEPDVAQAIHAGDQSRVMPDMERDLAQAIRAEEQEELEALEALLRSRVMPDMERDLAQAIRAEEQEALKALRLRQEEQYRQWLIDLSQVKETELVRLGPLDVAGAQLATPVPVAVPSPTQTPAEGSALNPLWGTEVSNVLHGNAKVIEEWRDEQEQLEKLRGTTEQRRLEAAQQEKQDRLANLNADNYFETLASMGNVYLEGKHTPVQILTAHYRLTGVGAATSRFYSEHPERRDTLVDDVEVIRKLVDAGELTANPPAGTATNVPETVTVVRPLVLTSNPKYPGDPMYSESAQEEYARMFRSDVDKAHNEGKIVVIVDSPSVKSQLLTVADMLPFVGFSRVAYEGLRDDLPGMLPSQTEAMSQQALHSAALMASPFLIGAAARGIGTASRAAKFGATSAKDLLRSVTPRWDVPFLDKVRINTLKQRAEDNLVRRFVAGEFNNPEGIRVILRTIEREGPNSRIGRRIILEMERKEPRSGGLGPQHYADPSSKYRDPGLLDDYYDAVARGEIPVNRTLPGAPAGSHPGTLAGMPGIESGNVSTMIRQSGKATPEINWNQILRDAQLKIAKANEQAKTLPRPSGLADEMEKSQRYRAEFHRLDPEPRSGYAMAASGLYLPAGAVGTVTDKAIDTAGGAASLVMPEPLAEPRGYTDSAGMTSSMIGTKGATQTATPPQPWVLSDVAGVQLATPLRLDTAGGAASLVMPEPLAEPRGYTDSAGMTSSMIGTEGATQTATQQRLDTGRETATAKESESLSVIPVRDTTKTTTTPPDTEPAPKLPPAPDLEPASKLPPVDLPEPAPQLPPMELPEPAPQLIPAEVPEPAPGITLTEVPEPASGITPAEGPEVTPEVFREGAAPITQAAETPLVVPLRTPPGEKPPLTKKRRRRKLPRIGLDPDDPSVQPSTGGDYPRLLRHTETVEVTTDLDTGLSHVELLKTVSPPQVVGRDSDPPVARPRFSGQQHITAQGRIVRSQPVKKRRKIVHKKLHPYAQYRRDIRRAQRRSGGRQA